MEGSPHQEGNRSLNPIRLKNDVSVFLIGPTFIIFFFSGNKCCPLWLYRVLQHSSKKLISVDEDYFSFCFIL